MFDFGWLLQKGNAVWQYVGESACPGNELNGFVWANFLLEDLKPALAFSLA